jgi:surfactin synthase thioesterase subunit
VTGTSGTAGLVVSFPAAGAGSTTFRWLARAAGERGAVHLPLANASSVDELDSGRWAEGAAEQVRHAAQRSDARYVVLVGHSMGGLSALQLSTELGPTIGVPVRVLLLNTPCPDERGRIPTMSRCTDAEIAAILSGDGFPPEVLGDEELLAEVAAGVRADAKVADRLAERVNARGKAQQLWVLATRDDAFIGTARCAEWRHRVSGEFDLVAADGGHMLDRTPVDILARVVDSVIASALEM